MRRVQILLDPELDDRLEREADARGVSKSALVRECVRDGLNRSPFDNGLVGLAGMFEGLPDDSGRHDEIVYEWGTRPS
jgi:hypothetical protein